jgi:hypothetical protein
MIQARKVLIRPWNGIAEMGAGDMNKGTRMKRFQILTAGLGSRWSLRKSPKRATMIKPWHALIAER